jgi:hypothetical protein
MACKIFLTTHGFLKAITATGILGLELDFHCSESIPTFLAKNLLYEKIKKSRQNKLFLVKEIYVRTII